MEYDEEFVNVMLKVLRKDNKRQNDTYTCHDVEVFDDVANLREFLFEKYKVELSPACNQDSFHLGYFDGKNRKLTITNTSQLVEAYSSAKDTWIKLWADPHIASGKSVASKRTFHQSIAFHNLGARSEADEGKVWPVSLNCRRFIRQQACSFFVLVLGMIFLIFLFR